MCHKALTSANKADGVDRKGKARATGADLSPEDQYCSLMQRMQYDEMSMSMSGKDAHHYASSASSPCSQSKVLRLAQEQTGLSVSLPLSWSSTALARVDEDRVDFMQVRHFVFLVICWLFDCFVLF